MARNGLQSTLHLAVVFVALFYEWVVGSSLAGFCKLYVFVLAGGLGCVERELAGLEEGWS